MTDDTDNLPSNSSSPSAVDAFLDKLNTQPVPFQGGAQGGNGGRLMFAMDATASREHSWDMAARIQGTMFEAVQDIGGLAVQLAFFRGFGEFKVSGWLSRAQDIQRLMSSVFCLAGQTQVEKVLKHARNEATLSGVRAVVYVGDCFEENVDAVGQVAGELGLIGVPVFVFHEGQDGTAERAFRHIAKLSGGAYAHFDATSAEQLKKLLAAVAVFTAGGRSALEAYAKVHGAEILQITQQMRGGG
ncbi:hypothetical protein [Magnetovibrio blakemorei]|uniref:VWA domain-containing protein n=1 Tax=Magnetovibrio blakemorei TaxID=28181 RepID=A0A1E5Q9D5_9PROT|nr:hypothetical protein [Magnetovibrio blakemorei]OEJ68102.1 hypothetical protein BEN30_07565 [Magnetovibrio blakemorei]